MSAPSVNSVSRQILVLHKSAGHVRFALPATLANPGSAAVIKAALLRIPGVRLVQVDAGTGKLGVHYDPIACSLPQLALVLKGSLEAAAAAAARPTATNAPPASGIGEIGQQLARGAKQAETLARRFVHRAQAQLAPTQPLDSGAAPGKLTPLRRAFDPALLSEKAVINFANDIVAFYLIRVHWNLITQHWLKSPLRHADVWLTVFYLTFLLVRYRKAAPRSPAKSNPAPPVEEKAAA
jgi:hypothetical protein